MNNESVTIAGVSVTGYNGTFPITVVDATHLAYTDATGSLAAGAGAPRRTALPETSDQW